MIHTLDPVVDKDSKILILGSFPSVKSRENGFYYAHPQNRFWRVIAAILEVPIPTSIEQKKQLMFDHHIALWDVIQQCDIIGSSDASIINVIPNDIATLLRDTSISKIIVNGSKASQLYRRHCLPITGIKAVTLPSTSPANASYTIERLISEWKMEIRQVDSNHVSQGG